mmetsp:Transcript_942/g.2200  ORF Transcript_942/g.2200 Transcript_942/m.2200 type:complete len:249 (-) Transcript_942:166-912(-)
MTQYRPVGINGIDETGNVLVLEIVAHIEGEGFNRPVESQPKRQCLNSHVFGATVVLIGAPIEVAAAFRQKPGSVQHQLAQNRVPDQGSGQQVCHVDIQHEACGFQFRQVGTILEPVEQGVHSGKVRCYQNTGRPRVDGIGNAGPPGERTNIGVGRARQQQVVTKCSITRGVGQGNRIPVVRLSNQSNEMFRDSRVETNTSEIQRVSLLILVTLGDVGCFVASNHEFNSTFDFVPSHGTLINRELNRFC